MLTLVVGVLIGQWLAFSEHPSPAEPYRRGLAAWEQKHYTDAFVQWSHAATLQPHDPVLHYRRATALARLGYLHAAADAYRLALLLEPPPAIARLARQGLADLDGDAGSGAPGQTVVRVEPARGVWIAPVVLNGGQLGRFLVDTGSSVTLVSPRLAQTLRLVPTRETVDLQTVGGLSRGTATTLASLRLGAAELRNVQVVVHEPGPDLDGILGNSVLSRYRVTLDAARRLLYLEPREAPGALQTPHDGSGRPGAAAAPLGSAIRLRHPGRAD